VAGFYAARDRILPPLLWPSIAPPFTPVATGRKNWMFAGTQRGGNSMAIAFTLIETTKLNKVDPQT
jgi:hypothetical protein